MAGNTPGVLLRNWITFMLRELVEKQEKKAYYQQGIVKNLQEFKIVFNKRVEKYVHRALLTYDRDGNLDTFLKTFAYNNILVTDSEDEERTTNRPFPNN